MAAPAAQPMRPPVTRAGALKDREELVVLLRRNEGRVGVDMGLVGFCCCFARLVVLLLDLGEIAILDVGGTVGIDEAMPDFLSCKVGRLMFVPFRTDGALACRVNAVGRTVEAFAGEEVSFGWFVFVLELALSAFLRAGFFRGFLLGVVLEGWSLAAGAAVSVDAAMSIYLLGSMILW